MSEKYLAKVELVKTIAASEPHMQKNRQYWFDLYQLCSEAVETGRLPSTIAQELREKLKNANDQ
ncbi:hypothetical protein WCE00_01705 [Acinetobacter haemolyticus]|uniref:hypothetical protein n=1 Tax=Acinetobacter haemolyticus TaxID=29430 RepID=UPI0034D4E590